MIDDLIKHVTNAAGVGETEARSGSGVVLAAMEKFGDAGAIGDLMAKIPGAADLAKEYAGTLEGGDQGGGGLLGKVLDTFGGDIGKVMGAIQGVGLDLDQAKALVPAVFDFIKNNVGEDVLEKALSAAPLLRKLI